MTAARVLSLAVAREDLSLLCQSSQAESEAIVSLKTPIEERGKYRLEQTQLSPPSVPLWLVST